MYVDLEKRCPYFEWLPDGKGNCLIYEKRDGRVVLPGVRCISAALLARAGMMPESCPYTKEIPGYRCRVMGFKEV